MKNKRIFRFRFIGQLTMLFLLVWCASCSNGKMSDTSCDYSKMQYAKGFSIDTFDNKTRVTIFNPKDLSGVLAQFYLLPSNYEGKLKPNEIKVPCQRIICLSSTQLAYLIELDAIDGVAGINSSRHLFNQEIKNRVKNGKILRVGKEGVFDTEVIAAINPDVIFVSPFKTGGYNMIKNMGIPLVPMAAYSEHLPLGRAEWIKFMSLFVDQKPKADSIFSDIANNYNHLKSLTKNIKTRPTVFSGKMKGSAWYVAGGDSFFAQLFTDAGADYVIKDNKTGASPMDFESVYALAHNAQYWRVLTSSPHGFGKKMLKEEDERYADFDAFKTGNVLVCNLRDIPYREESGLCPQVLLADYIHHFHPNLLPDYKPVYWKKIGE
ncbi:ABC transporter substrate-binding protein [Carboxylicivirga linearis]|uniref:ABC transporter substrate-binding protein n=1 Tax=Carboxylicivirga linearis TaxID=1628157 RepID=A0ABS5JXL1_9BACT|nr:ABC transporter substrate-binding protein [Carboxylicivirga linearis]MBS2099568.1 ABC transporter substrate-binding protein [Carboxylicivirga linearis]